MEKVLNQGVFNYPWPAPSSSGEAPIWTGRGFRYKGELHPVFCYNQSESNWTSELTTLHEMEAGLNHPIDIASRRLAIDTVKKYCKVQSPILLEIGSSSGYLLSELQATLPQIQLIGSDFISEPLLRVSKTLPGIPFIQFDLQKCVLPSESLDAIILLNVLEHIEDDSAALSHVARILKKGGIAHIEVPSGPACYDIYDEYLMHHRRYKINDLVIHVKKLGFEIIKATHLGFFVYPAFYIIKRFNKKLLSLPQEEKKKIVVSQIRKTKASKLFEIVVKTELKIGELISFPFGIRCVLVLRKKG